MHIMKENNLTPTILHISNSVTLSQSSKIKIKIVLKKSNRQKKVKKKVGSRHLIAIAVVAV